MGRYFKFIFIIAFFLICAFPLYGLLWYEEPEVTENKVPAAFPAIWDAESGRLNINYMSEFGDWFSDHFAGRQEMVTANALVNGRWLKSSSENIVIVGRENWLFYRDSLADYQGTKRVTARGLNNIVTSLALIQEYVQRLGSQFLFVAAPNKNTLYPQYMLYYYPKRKSANTLELLEPLLAERGIAYADAKEMFKGENEILYHAGDSHWNNRGAAMVQELLLDSIGQPYTSVLDQTPEIREDFEGDLDTIFYPLARHREREWDYSRYFHFTYDDGNPDTTQNHIETTNPIADGSLVMFRDSFGNSLVPFMADAFGKAYFTKTVPIRVDETDQRKADVFILEIVERNLDQFQRMAPVMPAPQRDLETKTITAAEDAAYVEVTAYDTYEKLSGMVDANLTDDDSPVYVRLIGSQGERRIYEMFPAYEQDLAEVTTDYGFAGYIPAEDLAGDIYDIEVITRKDGQWISSGVIGRLQ